MGLAKQLATCAFSFCLSFPVFAGRDDIESHRHSRKTLHGTYANELMTALSNSGVRDTEGRMGAINFNVDSIICNQAVVLNPKPHCRIMFQDRELVAPDSDAEFLFRLLKLCGAVVTQSQFHPQLGMIRVGVHHVHCSQPVVPNPQATCTFEFF